MKRCIYCLEIKSEEHFRKPEHVLNQAFGRFEQNYVSYEVCGECNQEFGDTFDRILARDTTFGLSRYFYNFKTDEYKGLGRNSKLDLSLNYPHLDINDFTFIRENNELKVMFNSTTIALFNFAKLSWSSMEMDDLPHRSELSPEYINTNGKINLFFQINNLEQRNKILMKGYNFGDEIFTLDTANVVAEREIDLDISRGIAKIAFNYLSIKIGDRILNREFNNTRNFIKYGVGFKHEFVELVCDSLSQRNDMHFLKVTNIGDSWYADVSFFMEHCFRVKLGYEKCTIKSYENYFDMNLRKIF